MLMPVTALATSDPPLTVERLHLKTHVNADGSSAIKQIEEATLLTKTGIGWHGQEDAHSHGKADMEIFPPFSLGLAFARAIEVFEGVHFTAQDIRFTWE